MAKDARTGHATVKQLHVTYWPTFKFRATEEATLCQSTALSATARFLTNNSNAFFIRHATTDTKK
jgi:hypothetical protein